MMKEYKHTQIGYTLLFAYSVVILVLSYLSIIKKSKPLSLVGRLIMLIVMGLFASLTVIVDDQMIKIKFGPGVIGVHFPLKDIEAHRVVNNPWYYGWGIRYTPRGWLFSVSGTSAVELQMTSGKSYRIGTDDPEGLATAIENALNHPPVQ